MTHRSTPHSRRLALTMTCVLLIFSSVSSAINTTHAQTRAYVANVGNSVSVIDVASNTVIASIGAPSPIGIAITPDGTKVYVTSVFSNLVSVIDTASNLVVAAIPVGFSPINLAITPDGTRAYVVNQLSNSVSVIDTATNTVIETIFIGISPFDVTTTITPDGPRAYWTASDGTHHHVFVRDTSTNTGIANILFCCTPADITATPDGTRVYVTKPRDDGVSIIDTSINAVIDDIPINSPFAIAITPNGTRAYVTSVQGEGPHTVAVVDTATTSVIASVTVGFDPFGVAITPGSKRAYVTNSGSDTVSVIDTATNLVIATIPVGSGPVGIAITPAQGPTNKDECKDGGYKNFGPPLGPFKNQGQCIKDALNFL